MIRAVGVRYSKGASYGCPKCGGQVKRVWLVKGFRWTCDRCQRDYGYNTDKPDFIKGAKILTKVEMCRILKEEAE